MKERNTTRHTASMARGQKFSTTSREAAIPSQHKNIKARGPLASQNTVGAYQ